MYKEIKKIMILILLTFAVGCSIILVSKSNGTSINQSLEEDLDADVDLLDVNKKDTVKIERSKRVKQKKQ